MLDPSAGQPPAAPADAPVAGSEPDVVHAVSAFFVGDTDRQGVDAASAWEAYGYNLDGWVSTSKQGFHCQPRPGGKAFDVRDDGPEGEDNSFGRNVVPLLRELLLASPSQVATAAVREGRGGWLLAVASPGGATVATGLSGSLWQAEGTRVGGVVVAPPAGDWSTHAWHPLAGTGVSFAKAYVTGGVLVARLDQPVVVSLPLSPAGWLLPVRGAILTVDLGTPGQGRDGTLAGLLPTEELVAAVAARLPDVSTELCDEALVAGLLERIRAASDSLLDGTQDPTRECDAISIGLGFTTRATLRGEVVAATPAPEVCSP
ncbi:MAG: hypothetical protein EOO75_20855 [Myxococcales bacterium]|nr:MAG: hypothetical protein EOO75_20855 [Myxococcales bacterium]